ncbi:molecular chaperone [Fredinandcohnia quinoae]|uniref:Molecular chaperone n=1 Tax=Fredinandcohnia quinoae TaxID=2918902 RepID=A0AAW5E9B9_9BACI|nr:molecular chaperone [Fredinandcohnia sp. SECRCQ15]MCH1625991.1 molecular chaperone [Fredinandcohnia sp. SECRCQ15]
MGSYSYKLYQGTEKRRSNLTYTREELEEMTTFHLRNICYKEKLVVGMIYKLDRNGLIETILRYLGAKEHLLINDFKDGGFQRLEQTLKNYLRTPLSDQHKIQVPAKLTLYKGLKMDRRDQYRVEAGSGIGVSNVLVINEKMELCGILTLRQDVEKPGSFVLMTSGQLEMKETNNQQYSLLFFRKEDSDYLYKAYYQDRALPPTNLRYYQIPVEELEIRTLESTKAVLAIDFGTSNTTAGAYLDDDYVLLPNEQDIIMGRIRPNAINYISFPQVMEKEEEWIELLPTVIAVINCEDQENIQYSYGFEALKAMKKNGFSSHATVFHGIKRWVNDYLKEEEIMDSHGNTAKVARKDLLRSYLKYIIGTAEHQLKCRFNHLHISSPVKLKSQFLDMFQAILPEYTIETEQALDEGMAVLYNTIANTIEKNQFLDEEEYHALVIDCGGGTTDLSSCRFQIRDNRISYKLDIHTTYENGETNFGGNNITYRIFQYLKISFAHYYSKNGRILDIDQLIEIPGADIFRHVDEFGVNSVYERLEQQYHQVEGILPTKFKLFENRSREEYQRVRHNFYFLWELADSMKKEFFRKTGVVRNRFHSEEGNLHENDLLVTAVDRWFLSIIDNEQFNDVYDYPDMVFNIQEMNHLIKADIYEIVRMFLDDFFQEGRLQHYSIIKLTGQSCRIDVFREALKEFVPGRTIEFRQKSEEQGKVPELKLACLRGAIRYISDRKLGKVEASITNDAPITPYSVSAYTHTQVEKVLISSLKRMSVVRGSISRPVTVKEVEFFLRGNEGDIRRKLIYWNDSKSYTPVLFEEIKETFGDKIPQDETDTIGNGEVKFFVFADENNWGFHLLPIAREHEQLYWAKKHYFAFENELSELDFFNGMK